MTSVRSASCLCGQVQLTCTGEPIRLSVCHCHDCQRRTGSAFAAQVRWPTDQVTRTGETGSWKRVADNGNVSTLTFCARCGSNVLIVFEGIADAVGIPLGAFAGHDGPGFPTPLYSVYEERQHPWVAIVGDNIDHMD